MCAILLTDIDEYVYLNLRDQKNTFGTQIRLSKELVRKTFGLKRLTYTSFIPIINIIVLYKSFKFIFSMHNRMEIARDIVSVGKSPLSNFVRKIKKTCKAL